MMATETGGRVALVFCIESVSADRHPRMSTRLHTVLRCVEVVAWCETAKSIVGAEGARVRPRAEVAEPFLRPTYIYTYRAAVPPPCGQ